MKLTCVTATFNCIKAGNRDKLIRCVESVAKLKTAHEHLVYDGASTDGTVELLRELEAKTPGLRVVSEPDTGIYNALNKGVRDAQGEWFYVLGCDDYIIHPQVLDEIIGETEESVVAVVTTVRRQTNLSEDDWFTSLAGLDHIFTGPCVCHQGELMRVDAVRELGGFDERYRIAADSDMFFKAHLRNFRFRYVLKTFAFFSYGGMAVSNIDKALREHRLSVANVLGLDERRKGRFVDGSHLLPLGVLIGLSRHRDIAIRQSARQMLFSAMKPYLRIAFYPLVVLTRPLRHHKGK